MKIYNLSNNFKEKWKHSCKTEGCTRNAYYDNPYCFKCFKYIKGDCINKKTPYICKLEKPSNDLSTVDKKNSSGV